MLVSISSSVWMEPRRGSLTCETCRTTLPCQKNYLTFGAFNGQSPEMVTRIALTKFLCLEQHFGDECSAFNPATETLAMTEQQVQEQVCLKGECIVSSSWQL